ncbi:MAG: hypothetical protein K2L77_03455 [Muribaculaceae bacterium]|nr:hypothetical protein [Muribaculaceae bacterium]
MSSKRQLKKRINTICTDLASDIQYAAYLYPRIDEGKALELLADIAALKIESLSKVTFSFDKCARDFDSLHEYHKALHAYKAAAYAKLRKEFADSAYEIVKRMNELVPAEVRVLVSPRG